jgi:NAD(P)-dependent dehydrogenase (short-subunit alcohol dehydrogenase family)
MVLPLLQSLPSGSQPFVAHLNSLAAIDPFAGLELYGAAKACTLSHTKWLASCVSAQRAHVLAIHPGTVKTDMVAQGILGSNPPAALRELFETVEKTGGFHDAREAAHHIVDFLLGENALKDHAHGKLYLADRGEVL